MPLGPKSANPVSGQWLAFSLHLRCGEGSTRKETALIQESSKKGRPAANTPIWKFTRGEGHENQDECEGRTYYCRLLPNEGVAIPLARFAGFALFELA
jgi:hypothetical protein